jgi:hypothetical protein
MAQCVCVRCGEETSILKSRRMDVVSLPENRAEPCVVFQCPKCSAVLGCQIDPISIKDAIVRELKALFQT